MVNWILILALVMATDQVKSDSSAGESASEAGKDEKHVIVVGGGLAGLTAVIEAVQQGARVTLLEGETDTGGNSAKSSSGINGCNTMAQLELGIQDSTDLFMSDTFKAGHQTNKRSLVERLVEESADAVKFLIDYGTNLTAINLLGGHSVPRTHWIPSPKEGKPSPVGVTIMRELKSQILAMLQLFGSDTVAVWTKTKALRLLTDAQGNVYGVECRTEGEEKVEKLVGNVILATGGYANDRDGDDSLLKEFAPDTTVYPTTNGPFARGSGLKMARSIGARLLDMDKVQLHPTGFVDPKDPKAYTKFLAAEALRGMGAILLNQDGRRFANELGTRDYLTQEILDKCQFNETANARTSYLLMNDEAAENFGWPAFNFYWKIKGFFQKVQDVDEFAKITGLDASNIRKTFNDHSSAASSKKDEFGKTVFPVLFKPDETLYFSTITPSIHYTMGGLEIDAEARVLRESDGKPIRGLFAAGEVTGGVHGDNRLGGNSLLECVVFGRIAAKNAASGNQESKPKDEL